MFGLLRRRRATGAPLAIGPDRAADIMKLVRAGWLTALSQSNLSTDTGEVEMNGRLRRGMRQAVNEGAVRSAKRISVLPGTESELADSPTPQGLTDISIHLRDIRERHDEHGPHAVIECKRVDGHNSALCRLYVVEGIDRFRTGKYASGYSIGFMASYVLTGSRKGAVCGINKYLSGKDRSAEHLGQSTIFAMEDWVRTSSHPRTIGEPVTLHHALLTFI